MLEDQEEEVEQKTGVLNPGQFVNAKYPDLGEWDHGPDVASSMPKRIPW